MTERRGKVKVEEFKLTPEQVAWGRNYRKVDKVSKMLQGGLQVKLNEVQVMRNALLELMQRKKILLEAAPEEPIHEVEGQEDMGQGMDVRLEDMRLGY